MQIVIRDLLFLNYAVPLERVRPLVPDRFELDTRNADGGNTRAFVSIVPFTIAEIRSSSWPLGRMSFNQINYRVYIAYDEGPAVYFLDLKVGSRAVSSAAGFIGLPVNYEMINLAAIRPDDLGAVRYSVESDAADGLTAQLTIDGSIDTSDPTVPTDFITERTFGFITSASGTIYKIVVRHPTLKASHARVASVRAPLLESLGILEPNQAESPHSVLYVEEAVFDADTPTKFAR